MEIISLYPQENLLSCDMILICIEAFFVQHDIIAVAKLSTCRIFYSTKPPVFQRGQSASKFRYKTSWMVNVDSLSSNSPLSAATPARSILCHPFQLVYQLCAGPACPIPQQWPVVAARRCLCYWVVILLGREVVWVLLTAGQRIFHGEYVPIVGYWPFSFMLGSTKWSL